MAAPKAVNYSATTEGESWVYTFRVITPGGHEFTERRAETIADWKDKKRDDPEVVQAAYAAIKDAIERRVDELDGPAHEGSLTFGEKGEVEGLGAAVDVETVESLRERCARYGALVAAIRAALDEHAPEDRDGE